MPDEQRKALENFDAQSVRLSKGSLSLVLIVTRNLRNVKFPVDADELTTPKGGQVSGLGGDAIRKILNDYGIRRTLSEEGGRTSRGNMGRLRNYIDVLNGLEKRGVLDLKKAEEFWIERVQNYFNSKPFTLKLDPGRSLQFCIHQLLQQATERQRESSGTMYRGAMMQHLIGAKIDLLGKEKVEHHGFAVADAPTNRVGDFLVGDVAIHITTAPTDTLIRKCNRNIEVGLRPLIITTEDGLGGARAIAKEANLKNRIDIIEVEQFLVANLYERSLFAKDNRPLAAQSLVDRYNEIIEECENDPSLKIEIEK